MDIRLATRDDADLIGQLLHDFNTEFGEPSPGPGFLAQRISNLPDTDVLVASDVAVVVLRFHPSLWTDNLECYLAELYVVPSHRGQGIGEALLSQALNHARRRGADYLFLGTSEDDVAARHLYEKAGMRRTEGDGGPLTFLYEKDLT